MSNFRCSVNGIDLCFDPVNSTCNVSADGIQVCVCSSDNFGPDNVYLHLATCNLPKNFYSIYLAIHCFLLALAAMILAPIYSNVRKGSLARQLVEWALIHHSFMVLFAASLLAQNGNFEAGIIFYTIKNVSLTMLVHKLLILMLEPISIGMGKDFRTTHRKLKQLLVFTCSSFVIYGAVMIGFARSTSVFNHIALGSISLNSFLCFCYSVALSLITKQMIETLGLLNHSPNIEDAKHRLKTVQRNFVVSSILVGMFPLVFVPYVMLGSIPYSFAFAAMVDCLFFGLIIPAQLYLVLRQRKSSTAKPAVDDGNHVPLASRFRTSNTRPRPSRVEEDEEEVTETDAGGRSGAKRDERTTPPRGPTTIPTPLENNCEEQHLALS